MPDLTRRSILKAAGGAALTSALMALEPPAWAAGAGDAPGQMSPEDGYDLWLRYRRVDDPRLEEYRSLLHYLVRPEGSPVLASAGQELKRGLDGLLDRPIREVSPSEPAREGSVVVGTRETSPIIRDSVTAAELQLLGEEGFVVRWVQPGRWRHLVIAGATDRGALYGSFAFLRVLQTQRRLLDLHLRDAPKNPLRLHNHWDNITDTVERGYAGSSIFEWSVPGLSPLVPEYGRVLGSLGINRTVVNNVNANPEFLTPAMLQEVRLVADALRPWGVRLMLSANFASPMVLGGLPSADPQDAAVQVWWREKAEEIYGLIPDFGGFLVKANSEGQPGPAEYGRTHAEGANVIARGVAPHGGIVIWRAFVYDLSDGDVSTDAYETFKPLDGQFDDNALVQAKYGPVDFHVREPVHPLFGALPATNMTLELQVTQEHTGHDIHLCYLVPWWKQVLAFDTHAKGPGTPVSSVVDGTAFGYSHAGISGVSNLGHDSNWTGHHLAQANAYGFGRLSWDPALSAEQVTDEWVRMTFGSHPALLGPLSAMLLGSWKTFEDYTSPLGIGNMVAGFGDHLDPDPEDNTRHADSEGAGNDRTVATGTGFTALYQGPWPAIYESLETCPDELLLFMHRVPYEHRLHSGKTMIQHIYDTHFTGLETVYDYRKLWDQLGRYVDDRRHAETASSFDAHVDHATLWRDTIVAYFFRLGRVLDERRSWLQVRPAGPNAALVLGGWPNSVAVEIGNAGPDDLIVPARIDAPEGWVTASTDATVPSRELVAVDLPVTPPAEGLITTVTADLDAGGLPVLGASSVQLVVTPAALRCVHALDGGSSSSPLLGGYSRLAPETSWDPARGFGWVGDAPQQRDRGEGLDALRRDFCADTRARTLRLALPAGTYRSHLLVGDVVGSQPTIVTVGGIEVARSRVLGGNEFEWLAFDLDGGESGREVDLVLSSVPGEYWHLGALAVVDPDAELAAVVISEMSASSLELLPERPADLMITLANTTEKDVTVEVIAEVGAGYTAVVQPASVTVPGGSTAELTVTVSREPGVGDDELVLRIGEYSRAVPLIALDNWVRVATMSASSTHAVSSPTLANDGVTDSEQWGNARGGWNDGTPDEFPDRLTATWDEPVTLSSVTVHTLDSRAYPASAYGLRDYDVQAASDSGWATLAEVRSNALGQVTSEFSSVQTTAIRIVVHDSNDHTYSRVMELEAFS